MKRDASRMPRRSRDSPGGALLDEWGRTPRAPYTCHTVHSKRPNQLFADRTSSPWEEAYTSKNEDMTRVLRSSVLVLETRCTQGERLETLCGSAKNMPPGLPHSSINSHLATPRRRRLSHSERSLFSLSSPGVELRGWRRARRRQKETRSLFMFKDI